MSMFHRGRTRLETVNRAVARAEQSLGQGARSWYSIRNAAGSNGEPAELAIYDEVGFWGVSAAQFSQDLAGITASEITMRVSSPGGDVFDGVAIYNMIRAHPAYVTAKVDGIAASIASVIVQAADRRVMMPHAQLMIHDAWGVAVGNAATMREAADMLDKQSDIIADVYTERAGGGVRRKAKIRAAMADETWFTDEQAVAFGLADAVERPAWKSGPDDAGPGDDDEETPDEEPAPAEDDTEAEDMDAMLRAELERLTAGDLEDLFT